MAHSLSLSLLSPSIRSSFHSTGASTRDRACSSTRDRSHASEIPSRNLRFYFGRRGSSCPCSTKEGERHPFLKDELRKRPPPPPFPRPIRPGSPNHYSLSSRWGNFRSKIDFSIGPLPESVHLLNAHLSSKTEWFLSALRWKRKPNGGTIFPRETEREITGRATLDPELSTRPSILLFSSLFHDFSFSQGTRGART